MAHCKVQMLDGTDLDLEIDKKASGQELFDLICRKLDLNEKDYFSCTFRDEKNQKVWLNFEKKLQKQLQNEWIVAFEIKFYPPDPLCLSEEITRYQLFLQLRSDVLSGKLPCSFVTQAMLGSYAAQSQLGNYIMADHGPGFQYLKEIQFAPNQTEDLLDKIAELHKTHHGFVAAEAEIAYLENACKLSMYGVHLYNAHDNENAEVQLGVCAAGMLVFKERLRIHRLTWPKILKISYKRNIFTIKIRPGEFKDMETTLDYRMLNYKIAKRLWKLCVEHHAFFRLRETEPVPRGIFSRFGPKYRYSGRTYYQAQKQGDGNYKIPVKRVVGRQFNGSKSMETVLTGISTERGEMYHTIDASRTNTLTVRNGRHGSVPTLDRDEDALQNYTATLSSIGGYPQPGFSTVNGLYENNQRADSDWGSQGRLINKDNGSSYGGPSNEGTYTRNSEVHYVVNNGGDFNSLDRNALKLGIAPQNLSYSHEDSLYEQNWTSKNHEGSYDPYGPGSTTITSTTRTYTTPNGTIITENRIERDGVIEKRVEKRFPDGGFTSCVDYDKALSDAILAVTNMDENLAVTKIEIQTRNDIDGTLI